MRKLGIITHVPPASHGFNSKPFLDNLSKLTTSAPLITFGLPGSGAERVIEDFAPLVRGPKWPHMSNYVFLEAMRMANEEGWTHVLYLEEDCRFGRNDWDAPLWDEFFSNGLAVVGGTPAIWHFTSAMWKSKRLRPWVDKVMSETGNKAPILFDKVGMSNGVENSRSPWLHPIGALAIYEIGWLRSVFPGWNRGSGTVACAMGPFDVRIGKSLWSTYGESQYDMFSVLKSSFSGYKSMGLTLEQRKELLMSGALTAVHPVKDGWDVVIT